jgi:tyrosinase
MRSVGATPSPSVPLLTSPAAGKIPNLPIERVVKNNSHREYFANIKAPKYAFNGPFAVYVFMGEFTSDKDERPYDPNLVGSVAVFATNIQHTGCGKCQDNQEAGLVVTGSVPLTSALLERIDEVGSLEIEAVEPYLTKNLHWRIHSVSSVP